MSVLKDLEQRSKQSGLSQFLHPALLARIITHCCVSVTEAERKKINQALGRSLSEWMPLLLLSSLLLARDATHINLRSFFLLGLEMERHKNGC